MLRFCKEILFPRWCCGCSSYGTLLCEKCFSQLDFTDTSSHSETEYLDSLSSLVSFEKISKSMVHQLKYNSVKEIAVLCARMMFMFGNPQKSDIITSIPLHPKRLNQRGFNQAEEIAKELAKLLHSTYAPILARTKHTTNLAKITDIEQRKKIITNQFAVLEKVEGNTVLIIDDVWTTGATLEEAAKMLKNRGGRRVHAYTFAHGL